MIPSEDPNELTYFVSAKGPAGTLFLTVREGRVTADVIGPDPLSIRSVGSSHVLDDIDASYLGRARCANDDESTGENSVLIASTAHTTTSPPLPMSPQVNLEVTVLVAYTPQVLTIPGVTITSIRDQAAAAINEMNQALTDSGQTIYVRVKQVGDVYAWNFNELDYSTQTDPVARFAYVRNNTYLDSDLVGARDTSGADLVVVLVKDQGNNATQTPPTPLYGLAVLQRPNCGVGQFAGVIACNPGAEYGYWSWAVVSFNFATTYATFAHEVGHVFGAEHEPLRGSSEGLQPRKYAYAHRVPGVVRDLMCGQECVPDTGTTVCTSTVAVQYSNPDKLFAGTSSPSGTYVPVYTADGNRYRNAARIIREFAPDMVGFRGVGEPARIFWDGFEQDPVASARRRVDGGAVRGACSASQPAIDTKHIGNRDLPDTRPGPYPLGSESRSQCSDERRRPKRFVNPGTRNHVHSSQLHPREQRDAVVSHLFVGDRRYECGRNTRVPDRVARDTRRHAESAIHHVSS